MQYSTEEFETLYSQCFPPSMRLAQSLLQEEEEARDIVQEVFMKVWKSEKKIDNPLAFILRAVRNACIDRINRLEFRERIRRQLMLDPPAEDFDLEQRKEEVMAAIQHLLTTRERQVVEKIYTYGMTYRDAAASLEISVTSINKNLVAALKKLRIHFKTGKT